VPIQSWEQLAPAGRQSLIYQVLTFFEARENRRRTISWEELQRHPYFEHFNIEQLKTAVRMCGAGWMLDGYREETDGVRASGLTQLGTVWVGGKASRLGILLVWVVFFTILEYLFPLV